MPLPPRMKILFSICIAWIAKLYRFDKDGNLWKEKGASTVKFVTQGETGKVRLVMRQSKTLKICANHLDPLLLVSLIIDLLSALVFFQSGQYL
ncbi:ran-binding protein 1 homolog c-like [Tripterygium wilfordii]|uniref:ran-binding protein 1 homolog c-like n=1 Tax=Tripterygium wilfordii TaxID=458696 RepID=UPI0018F85647|nr:ran-binding protein 1 homolog c-like [Tripterygium wilfordii]